jgi:hypothetical protein
LRHISGASEKKKRPAIAWPSAATWISAAGTVILADESIAQPPKPLSELAAKPGFAYQDDGGGSHDRQEDQKVRHKNL